MKIFIQLQKVHQHFSEHISLVVMKHKVLIICVCVCVRVWTSLYTNHAFLDPFSKKAKTCFPDCTYCEKLRIDGFAAAATAVTIGGGRGVMFLYGKHIYTNKML